MIPIIKALTAGLLIATTQIDPTTVDQQCAEMYFRAQRRSCMTVKTVAYGASRCTSGHSFPLTIAGRAMSC